MTIDSMMQRVWNTSDDKGWHDLGKRPAEDICLMHSELSEALEELRNGRGLNETYYNEDKPGKPEGVPSELADVIIRIFDFAVTHEIDLFDAIETKMKYNDTRPYLHGGKKL